MQTAIKISAALLFGLALMGTGFFLGHHAATPAPNLTGTWEVHSGKAVDTLTLADDKGVPTGQLTRDPQWGGTTSPVHGTRVAQDVEWIYEWQNNGPVHYTFRGTLDGDAMGGSFTMLGSFSAFAPQPADEKNLWTARKEK